jgi:hypothetical protein
MAGRIHFTYSLTNLPKRLFHPVHLLNEVAAYFYRFLDSTASHLLVYSNKLEFLENSIDNF